MSQQSSTQSDRPAMGDLAYAVLEVADPEASARFYRDAVGLDDRVRVRHSEAATSGFRGFTLSLTLAQPADVDLLVATATDASATTLKPAAKSFWGYGGVLQAPDGTICTVASSSKKSSGPATRHLDEVVLQLGVTDVAASKQFYVEHGLTVAKSYGRKYVQLGGPSSPLTLALYKRSALAKLAGVAPEGDGSHRLTLHGAAGDVSDPDGFVWSQASESLPDA